MAPGLVEQEEEWEQQAGWSKAARGKKQVLEDGQEDAPEEARAEQAGMPEGGTGTEGRRLQRSPTRRGRCCGRAWLGGAGQGWCRQWGVPQVEALLSEA